MFILDIGIVNSVFIVNDGIFYVIYAHLEIMLNLFSLNLTFKLVNQHPLIHWKLTIVT